MRSLRNPATGASTMNGTKNTRPKSEFWSFTYCSVTCPEVC
jgi:hypothetical protein